MQRKIGSHSSSRPWNTNLPDQLQAEELQCIHDYVKEELTDNIQNISPDWIFVPHWSYFIDNNIIDRWQTVVFHMTDLPFGRGGVPSESDKKRLEDTHISAIKCSAGIDDGPVYLKEYLGLHGTAEEILTVLFYA